MRKIVRIEEVEGSRKGIKERERMGVHAGEHFEVRFFGSLEETTT